MSARWDAVVVGAGAAGLLAAAHAAELGRRTLLLEKNRKPGVKILMSGGTRCNLTHDTDAAGILAAYGKQGRFLRPALMALDPPALVQLFYDEGVPTKVEETGKVFPVSDRAVDVLDALLRRLHRSGATLQTAEPVEEVTRDDGGFQLRTPTQTVLAEHVLLTTGGKSYPGCGTRGDGYRFAAQLGHTIVPLRPALVPLTSDDPWVRSLQGITLPDAIVRVFEPDATRPTASGPTVSGPISTGPLPKAGLRDETRGGFLFAHFGMSGPAVLDISRTVTGHPHPRSLLLVCDWLPQIDEAALDAALKNAGQTAGAKSMIHALPGNLPSRMAHAVLDRAGIPPTMKAAELSKSGRAQLIECLKRCRIPLTGSRGFDKAEVTAGGVALDEVHPKMMESKKTPGLFLAGEILDLDGPIGGYNFQAAFSTGWLAAEHL